MKEIKKKIEEILKEYNRNYKEYTLEAAMENNPTPNDKLIEDIIALIQKEREDAIKDIVKDIGNLKLKERKIDYSYVNIPEEWEAEPENIEKRGYNQAVREINNKIYLFITNNLSQTKGDKE
jgi:hypothetical protein